MVRYLAFLFLLTFSQTGRAQKKWHEIKDSTFQISFPTKPFLQQNENLDEGGVQTVQMEYRDFRMTYLFLVRTFPEKDINDKTVLTSALIQGISEMVVSVNYIFKDAKKVKSTFNRFASLEEYPDFPAMEAEYFAKSSYEQLSMKVRSFFYGRQLFLLVVFSKGDRLFDLNKTDRFFNSFQIITEKEKTKKDAKAQTD